MEEIFNSLGQPIYNFNGHKGYMLQWKLIAPFCKKWSRNRDPDIERVNDMIKYYQKGGYIPRIIHLAEVSDEGIVCYDGNHRKEVFNKCNDENILCIIDIMFNATQHEVYKAFTNINKSVQLPAIYVEELVSNGDNDVKVEIINLVKEFEIKYKSLLSPSTRYHSPNFNRDAFTDNIYNIYKALGKVVNINQIGKLLDKLNNEYANGNICRPHSVYKQTVLDKCRKHNMWLFIDRTIPFEHIEKLLNS